MHKLSLTAPLFLALVLAPACHIARAQDAPAGQAPTEQPTPEPSPRRRFRIGLDVGAFFPSSGKTRDRFGGTWLSIGPGLGAVRRAGEKGRIGLDVDVMTQKQNGNRALVIPIGASYTRALGRVDEEKFAVPYVGASVLAVPAKLKSLPDNIDSGLKVGAGASAFVGTTFGEQAFVEARYMVTSRVEGFSLSGASVRAGYRF